MAQLRFYKNSVQPTQNLAAGAVWFNTTLKTIEVYNGSAWEKFAGKLSDAVWDTANQKLTIKKADGSEIALDFSNIASLSGVQAALSSLQSILEGKINEAKQAAATADGKAVAAQGTADEAVAAVATEKGRAEGEEARIEGLITQESTDRANADTALGNRISTLEGQITGLSGTLHFRDDLSGTGKPAPTTSTEGAVGDFMVAGDGSEYICIKVDGSTYTWEKIGDTSAESAALAALEGRMTAAEGEIAADKAALASYKTEVSQTYATQTSLASTEAKAEKNKTDIAAIDARVTTAEGKITAAEGKITALETFRDETVPATYVDKTTYNGKVSALEAADSQNASDIEAVAGRMTTAEGKISAIESEQDTQDGLIQENAEAIAALEEWKNDLSVGVTSVTGDAYVTASPTSGAVQLSVNATTAVTKDSASLVTSGAVASAIESALAWEEFN